MSFTTRLDIEDIHAGIRDGAEHGDVYFRVIVESFARDAVRMNVAVHFDDSDEAQHSQGIDLRPSECRVLAKMLLAAAEQAEDSDLHPDEES